MFSFSISVLCMKFAISKPNDLKGSWQLKSRLDHRIEYACWNIQYHTRPYVAWGISATLILSLSKDQARHGSYPKFLSWTSTSSFCGCQGQSLSWSDNRGNLRVIDLHGFKLKTSLRLLIWIPCNLVSSCKFVHKEKEPFFFNLQAIYSISYADLYLAYKPHLDRWDYLLLKFLCCGNWNPRFWELARIFEMNFVSDFSINAKPRARIMNLRTFWTLRFVKQFIQSSFIIIKFFI